MSAQKVLDVARAELGTVESPAGSNRTKYGRAYGMDGNAWCAMFTWWCFQQSGLGALVPKTAYTPALADHFRKAGRWSSVPQVGDLVLFDFPGDGVNRISHVGLVEKVNGDGSVTTIEGNTSSGQAGSQRDGGGVYRRVRRAGIVGYAHPDYGTGPAPAQPPATAGSGSSIRPGSRTVRRGDSGTDVEFLHRYLGVVSPTDPGYGTFGPLTERNVERYQRLRGLVVDGIVGPATWREMGQ